MATGGISGIGAFAAASGLFLMYAGIADVPLAEGLREVIAGRRPTGRPAKPTAVRFDAGQGSTLVSSGSGAMIRPVPGNIGDGFGAPRPGRKHLGVDIAAPAGTPIRAALAGTVSGKGYNVGAGNYINLTHANSLVTKYFHLSAFETVSGATVSAGQTIGYVGSTGNSSGPHLHFEVWRDGVAVDPAPYLGGGAVSV